jgi:hypothetical protein
VRSAIDELAKKPAADSESADGEDKLPAKPHPIANLELIEIDAAAENPLEALPPPIREEAAFILERATVGDTQPELPRFAVVLPHGYPMYEGPLTADDVRAIANSPARQKLVELLAGDKATVLILLEGEKADENAEAETLIDATIERAAAGELSPPPDPALSTTDADAKPAKVDVGVLRIRRDDPAEKWFVMSLLHVEPEIDERTDAMVYSVYARGRVNPPAIGTGISEEELEKQVRFVLGPCACTIKHDNPGMDLALVADWGAIALAMAKKHGSETGNEKLLDEVPGLFPATGGVADAPVSDPSKDSKVKTATDVKTVEDAIASGKPSASPQVAAVEPAGEPTSLSASDEGIDVDATGGKTLRNVGIGVLVGILVLAAASTMLLRRPV